MHVQQIKGRHGFDQPDDAQQRGEQAQRPLLMLDIDGVISLFGFEAHHPPAGCFHSIEGIPHYLSALAGPLLAKLSDSFELIWASGWGERANDHLPHLLSMPSPLPFLTFERSSGPRSSMLAHWKLDAVDAHAGNRALAWVDDAFNEACASWAAKREAPTLLVATEPQTGLTMEHAERLLDWAGDCSEAHVGNRLWLGEDVSVKSPR